MEQDNLKSAWQDIDSVPKSNTEVKLMMRESAHPVLKRIRKQLILESAAFTVFLLVYYDFFDGDRKPLYANLLLVTAMLFIIMHNIIGYMLMKSRVKGHTIKLSLEEHLSKMKVYAVVSVASRALAAGCLLLFFTSVITFNADKYWILAAGILVCIIQITLLSRIWMKRIRQIKSTTDSFTHNTSNRFP